jgi:hypothetical protein
LLNPNPSPKVNPIKEENKNRRVKGWEVNWVF